MEFSFVNGQRRKPEPSLAGVCDLCGAKMISRCGNIRIHHWAHWRRTENCDPWWENETQWHRDWKSKFPTQWREVVISNDGQRHRADVKTDYGRVFEFQNSPIKLEDRLKREAFYKDMAWVVNGSRLDSYSESFNTQLAQATCLDNNPVKLRFPIGNCSILKTWADSAVDVFVDFGDTAFTNASPSLFQPLLWRLCPAGSESHIDIIPTTRESFIKAALEGVAINGIHAPELKIDALPKKPEPLKPRNSEPQKHERRESETDTGYALRVWNFDGVK